MSDIRINGKGTFSSGTYDAVVINGSGLCEGGFTAESVKANGSFRCQGDIETQLLHINGSLRCDGDVQAGRINTDGKLKCAGSLRAESLDCDGFAEVLGSAQATEVDVDGMFTVSGGNLEAEHIRCDGSIRCVGQISADFLEADGFINARELVGDRIIIHSQMSGLARLFTVLSSKADLIEATTIELQGVTAQAVNGRDVVIGPGCTIDQLDCSGTLSIHPTSLVRSVTGNYSRAD